MKTKLFRHLHTVFFILPFLIIQNIWSQTTERTFICFSDLHFNPFHNRTLIDTLIKSPYEKWDDIFINLDKSLPGKYGEDTDNALFNSLLDKMESVDHNPDFIIYGGDFLAHHFLEEYHSLSKDTARASSNAFILKTFKFITTKISKHFSNCPVYFTLGNNDSYTGDYNSIWNGQFNKQTASVFFENFIKDESNKSGFTTDYSTLGSYAIPYKINDDQIKIISLNTNFLSIKCPRDQSINGKKLLDWLVLKLEEAKKNNEKVWIINHIPPGVDVYNTTMYQSAGQPIKLVRLFMTSEYNNELLSVIKKYKDVIAANFSGHIHTDDFRLYKDDDGTAYAFTRIIPSVSPIFGNNPAFQVFNYDAKTFSLLDYETYNVNLINSNTDWNLEYDFNDAYKQNGINVISLNSICSKIYSDESVQSNYTKLYVSSSSIFSIEKLWKNFWLGISNLTDSNYSAEYNKYEKIKN